MQEAGWWEYTVCPNAHVMQTHKAPDGTPEQSVELGSRVERITQTGQNSFAVEYTEGAPCRASGARSVRVEYFCDDLGEQASPSGSTAPALIDVSEPQACVYAARIHLPELCAAEPRKKIACKVVKS